MNLIVSKISAWHEKTCQWNLIVSKISDCHEKNLGGDSSFKYISDFY